jgi:hypothetical protein
VTSSVQRKERTGELTERKNQRIKGRKKEKIKERKKKDIESKA